MTVAEPARAPAALGQPLAWPDPAPDCDVCTALDKQRTEASAANDGSKVSDCNVEIRRHPHQKKRRGARP